MIKQVSIGDVFEFVRNGASIKQEDNKSGFPITRIETIWNETIDENRFGYADIFDKELVKYEKYLLDEGDILMTHINSPKHLGKSAMYNGFPEKLIHGMNLLCLRPNKAISNSRYLKHYLNSSYFKELLPKISNQSVNQASFSAGNLKSLQIPLPPLPQQQKIANILDAADELRQNSKALVGKYDELTQSLFLDMFGDPVSNPMGWEMKLVEDIASNEKHSIKAGPFGSSLKKEFYVDKGYKIYGQEQVIKDDMSFGDYYINETKYKELENCKVKAGDVLVSLVGTYGKISIIPELFEEGIINPRLMKLTTNKKIIRPDFLKFLLQSQFVARQLKSQSRGGTMDIINVGIIRKVIIPLPPIKIQDQFAERVAIIEEQKAIAQKSLGRSEELFNSLLQKAFKGELA